MEIAKIIAAVIGVAFLALVVVASVGPLMVWYVRWLSQALGV